jgi:hypothetical protein
VTPTATPQPLELAAARAADRCQRAIVKAGAAFVGKKLGSLRRCAGGIFTCVQTALPGDQRCGSRAEARCATELAKIVAEEAKLKAAILKNCGVPALNLKAVTNGGGLGYAAVGAECAADFGSELLAIDDVADCVMQQHGCHAEQLFAMQAPRGGELMELAGVDRARLLPCLRNYGGGGHVGDPRGIGKALLQCGSTIEKRSAAFVTKDLKSRAACASKVFTCRQLKPESARCLARAAATCDKGFAKIVAEATKLDLAVDKKCLAIDFDSVLSQPAGAHLAAPAEECARFGVGSLATYGDYKQCLFRQHQCGADELLRFESPRAEELLGLAGREFPDPACPPPATMP